MRIISPIILENIFDSVNLLNHSQTYVQFKALILKNRHVYSTLNNNDIKFSLLSLNRAESKIVLEHVRTDEVVVFVNILRQQPLQ